ncbi:MAG: peptidylprolyl isomerase, partial [Planctomycetota bacterium]
SQFFVNLGNNTRFFDTDNGGYTAFARIADGFDVINTIQAIETFNLDSVEVDTGEPDDEGNPILEDLYPQFNNVLTDVPLNEYNNPDASNQPPEQTDEADEADDTEEPVDIRPDTSDFIVVEQMTQVEEMVFELVSQSNTDLATATLTDDGVLEFTPGTLASGTSDITVRGTDLAGVVHQRSFTLVVGQPDFSITTNKKNLKEKRGKSKFDVTRSGFGTDEATINLRFAGKAKLNKDYKVKAKGAQLKGKKLTFPAGTTTARLTVQAKDDRSQERTEKFEIIVNAFDNLPLSLGQQVKAKFKIKDDD